MHSVMKAYLQTDEGRDLVRSVCEVDQEDVLDERLREKQVRAVSKEWLESHAVNPKDLGKKLSSRKIILE